MKYLVFFFCFSIIGCSDQPDTTKTNLIISTSIESLIKEVDQNQHFISRLLADEPSSSERLKPTIDFAKKISKRALLDSGKFNEVSARELIDLYENLYESALKSGTPNTIEKLRILKTDFPAFKIYAVLWNSNRLLINIISNHTSSGLFTRLPIIFDSYRIGDSLSIDINTLPEIQINRPYHFEIDELKMSSGKIITEHSSTKNIELWNVGLKFPKDSSLQISGSFYEPHPITGEIRKVDTFKNRLIKVPKNP